MTATIHQHPAARAPSGGNPVASAPPPDGRGATKARQPSNIRRYLSPAELRELTRDYDAPFTFVPSEPAPPTRGERLVEFVRLNGEEWSFYFAMFAVALALGIFGGAFIGWLA